MLTTHLFLFYGEKSMNPDDNNIEHPENDGEKFEDNDESVVFRIEGPPINQAVPHSAEHGHLWNALLAAYALFLLAVITERVFGGRKK